MGPASWWTWIDWKASATIIQAIAIVVTAYFASRGLSTWRHQLVGKRRFEVAEEVLVRVLKARWNLNLVRNPMVFSGEGKSLEGIDDTAAVPLERMQKMADEFAELGKTRVLADVHLGPDAAKLIGDVLQAFYDVGWAASMLAMTAGEAIPDDPVERRQELGRRQKWRLTIWAGPAANSDPSDEARG